jgi:membrane-bound lytic murein transglycosylase B
VAHLADRLKGAGEFAASWPRDTKFPDLVQRRDIQAALTRLKYYDGPIDGRLGPVTAAAYAKYQVSRGEVADGFITLQSWRELTGR